MSPVNDSSPAPDPPAGDGPRKVVASYAPSPTYTEMACDDGSLWRWRKVRGWRLVAVVPGSLAARTVQREGRLDGYEVRPDE